MAEETPPIVELAEWFQTPPGQYVLAWEQAQFDEAVADIFGYYAWQVGLAEPNLLRANRMPFKAWVGAGVPPPELAQGWQACVAAAPDALPFESQSVDLLVLPHAFECAEAPHLVLREVERVLVPEGRVVISGFNPWSLWGARNLMPGMEAWLPLPLSAQVALPRLKDWFKLLSFEVERGRFGCYAPACRTDRWLRRWRFMERYGQRWWGLGGAVYVVTATKKVAAMRLIGPAWKTRRKRAQAASVAVNRQADDPGR
ncbi:class I SAM-dependent methyltransferase [Bordetella bronchiseptica]|uniref:class I SAM-dependent methyltransferase n=1 Tax=Bordetella bronchiseptica TaxID=518 RepID=UPI00045A6D40|nr:methyltransferase domain-containing protein [Bordetella bronchiseptica]AZW32647.1 methyltransferase domain-containing protein [Bordetella bronchiseptica]KAK53929.1 methyltransferase domain protein [Bordetella bronchiseptica OSU054]KCV42726.1 methyltransferase domain protein [Bordetella bronchiseptica 345]KCV55316.1 methyltransferase domain protein [Bordetella bronchiseptica 7E71]KDB71460.1 methyltransferase domain protein [Bordetella bronchiseptica CA90 BB1334]